MKLNTPFKTILQLIRLPAGFSAISNVIAAHIIASSGHLSVLTLLLSLSASLGLYFGGMALNDCFDFAEDSSLRNDKALPSGKLSLQQGWAVAISLVLLGLLSAAFLGWQVFTVAVTLAVCIVLYNSKLLPDFLAACLMGGCRYLNWLMALAVFPLTSMSFLIPIPLLLYVTALTSLAEAETDTHNRQPLYMAIVGMSFVVIAVFLLIFNFSEFPALSSLATLLVGGYFALILQRVAKVFEPQSVQKSIGQLVMGVILLDVLMLVIFSYWVWALLVLILIFPGKYLRRWIYVS